MMLPPSRLTERSAASASCERLKRPCRQQNQHAVAGDEAGHTAAAATRAGRKGAHRRPSPRFPLPPGSAAVLRSGRRTANSRQQHEMPAATHLANAAWLTAGSETCRGNVLLF
jgi:hypothetical protein